MVSWAAHVAAPVRIAARGWRSPSPSGSRRAAATTVAVATDGENVELSFLVDNSEQAVKPAEALIAAFEAKNPNINDQARDAARRAASCDNLVKTRLATGEMNDVFVYNSRLAVPGAQARSRSLQP